MFNIVHPIGTYFSARNYQIFSAYMYEHWFLLYSKSGIVRALHRVSRLRLLGTNVYFVWVLFLTVFFCLNVLISLVEDD